MLPSPGVGSEDYKRKQNQDISPIMELTFQQGNTLRTLRNKETKPGVVVHCGHAKALRQQGVWNSTCSKKPLWLQRGEGGGGQRRLRSWGRCEGPEVSPRRL